MKFRRILALALVGTMALSATAFAEGETTEITMWTYPVGDWGNAEVMDGLVAKFNEAHPEISVKIEYLDYTNGDEAKIAAAKTFIDFMANDESMAAESVKASTYWPVKDLGNIYEGDELMTEYSIFTQYMGDYYQVVGGWAEARTAWWNMLQQIGTGADVATAVAEFQTTANAAAGQ